jgi:ComF family protein
MMTYGADQPGIESRTRRLPNWVAASASRVVRTVLPPNCLACGAPISSEGALCPSCWNGLRLIERPSCDRLAIPFSFDLGAGALSAEAISNPPPFERLRAVALFDGTARQLVHALKYRDHLELVRWMGEWMARAGGDVIADADVIVPVPLHWRRLWRRRFNQSAALAAAIAKQARKPVSLTAMRRVRPTRNQVGLGEKARSDNVRGAFRVEAAGRPEIAGRRVLVVDDVYTTGATIKAVTRAVRRAGASSVDALVFARVARGAD